MAGKVLIVDDERIVRELLAEMLREAGYETCEAGTGKEALARVTSERPSLMVLDLMLPDIDGWTVLEQLRAGEASEGRPQLPVVVLTRRDEPEIQSMCIRLGADFYLEKSLGEERALVTVVDRFLSPEE